MIFEEKRKRKDERVRKTCWEGEQEKDDWGRAVVVMVWEMEGVIGWKRGERGKRRVRDGLREEICVEREERRR